MGFRPVERDDRDVLCNFEMNWHRSSPPQTLGLEKAAGRRTRTAFAR